MQAKTMLFSVYGVPVLGLAGLLVCLWHPQVNLAAVSSGPDTVYLVQPSPRLDRSMTVFLEQEAKTVAYRRKYYGLERQAKTIANYNIVAQECTPAVFEQTHLPPAMAF